MCLVSNDGEKKISASSYGILCSDEQHSNFSGLQGLGEFEGLSVPFEPSVTVVSCSNLFTLNPKP